MGAWLPAISAGVSLLGNLFGGKESKQSYSAGSPMPMMPEQLELMRLMIRDVVDGSGEYGFAQAYDTGLATARGAAERLGGTPGGGGYNTLASGALTEAVLMDAMNRRNFALGLASSQVPMMPSGGTQTTQAPYNAWDAFGDLGNAGLAYSFRPQDGNKDTVDEMVPTPTYVTAPPMNTPTNVPMPNFGQTRQPERPF